jgi:DNA polymerase-3 subunit beta
MGCRTGWSYVEIRRYQERGHRAMKITVPSDMLAAVCGWVTATARLLTASQITPVLSGIMFDASPDGTLTVTGFGYEISAVATMDAEVHDQGRVLLPARILTEAARRLPAQPAHLAMNGTRVTITAGRVTYNLPVLPHEDYPDLPAPGPHIAEFTAATLTAAVQATAAAASHDNTLPALTCVCMMLDGKGTATLAATDRYRLAITTCPYTHHGDRVPEPVLICARDLAAITRHPGDDPACLAVSPDGRTAGITTGNRHVTTRLITAEYPHYAKLIPATHDTAVTASIPELAAAIKRAAVVAERNTPVRLGFRDSEVLIESGTSDDAALAEIIPVTVDGPPITIGFNHGYLLEALTAISAAGSTTVRITMTSPAKPAVLTPARPPGPVTATHVLMPVRCAG